MPFNSWESRKAEEYQDFLCETLKKSHPVGGELRKRWFETLCAKVTEWFPESEKHFRKPGLASCMFSIEVATPDRDKEELLERLIDFDAEWIALAKPQARGGASLAYPDRLDAVWEFVMDLEGGFVTGAVKLRNATFDMSSGSSREVRDSRPPDRRGSTPRRAPSSSRPSRPPFGRGGRPSGRRER